jgi:hypothetical protein
MTARTLAEPADEVVVRSFFSTCATRERGQKFYPVLREHLDAIGFDEDLIVSFEDVEFVSPSFLDETIVRLTEEMPQKAERIRVLGLHGMAAQRLRSALRARGTDVQIED